MTVVSRLVIPATLVAAGAALGVWLQRSGWLDSAGGATEASADPAQPSAATPATGMWHSAPDDVGAPVTGGSAMDANELANLPYLRGSQAAPEVECVTLFEVEATHPGLNLVVSGHEPRAELQDLKGNVLHEWHCAFDTVWPGGLDYAEAPVHRTFWRRAHLLPNGELLAIFEGYGMVKLDRESNVVWAYDGRAHHDLDVRPDGRIYTLTRVRREDAAADGRAGPPTYLEGWYLDDRITVLAANGAEESSLSLLECLENSEFRHLLSFAVRSGDVLHANTIEVMDGSLADLHPMYAAGNVLVSLLTLHTVAMIDPRAKTVVWAAPGVTRFQHQPTVLADGRILVFDNLGDPDPSGPRSRVIELDPRTLAVEWSFASTAERVFSSYRLGSCQRLANGNTLITESTAGRALEVRRDGEVVWEWVNPHRAGEDDALIATLFEVVRLDLDYFAGRWPELEARFVDPGDAGALDGLDEALKGLGGSR